MLCVVVGVVSCCELLVVCYVSVSLSGVAVSVVWRCGSLVFACCLLWNEVRYLMLLLVVVGVCWLVGRWLLSLVFVMLCRCLMSAVCSFCFLLGVSCCLWFVVFGCCRLS